MSFRSGRQSAGPIYELLNHIYRDRHAYFFIAPAYILFGCIVFLPVVVGIGLAFFETSFVRFEWVGLDNFQKLLNSVTFRRAVGNTIFYVAVGVPATIVMSLMVALLVYSLNSKLRAFFRAAFYLPAVAGGVVLSLVWIWVFNPTYGLLNWVLGQSGLEPVLWLASSSTARWAVVIVLLTQTIGAPIILFLAGLGSIPTEVQDAATVDGARSWQRVRYITLPLLRPVLMFVVATTTIGIFQIWETIYLLTSGGPAKSSTSIVYEIYETAFLGSGYGLASAMAVILMTIVMVVTLVQLRMWNVSYLD